MTYPNNIDRFVTKIDKNASGWYVSGENFNVPSSPYNLFLDHVPKDSATTIILPSGGGTAWTEDFTGSPAAGEYYVNYDVGKLTFNSADVGTALESQYQTLGDDIMAEHVNDLQLAASGVEWELGLGCRGSYDNVSQRLDSFMTIGSSLDASQVNIITPPGLSATTVQQFIDLEGTANRTDINPFGIGWNDIYNTDGDMVRAQNNITTGYLFANTVSASGNFFGINVDGPDADSWIYFYDNASPIGQWLKWDDGDNRFELSTDLYVQGDIIASGNVSVSFLGLTDTPGSYAGYSASGVRVNTGMTGLEFYDTGGTGGGGSTTFLGLTDTPGTYSGFESSGVMVNPGGTALDYYAITGGGGGTSDHNLLNNLTWSMAGHTIDAAIVPTASGTQSVGTYPLAFNEGHFDNLYSNYIYGDGSFLTGIGAGYVHYQTSASVAWIVDHNLGTDEVIVQCTDNSVPPLMVVPTEIEYTNNNRVTVTFSGALAGEARVVSASGAPSGGGGGGSTSFLGLTDTPAAYTGMTASGVRVNTGETALEFYDISATSPSASGNVIGTHVYNQVAPATVWAVTHGLGTEDVIVQCTDDGTPKNAVIPEEIEFTDANNITITFESPYAGEARIIAAHGTSPTPGGIHSSLTNLEWSAAAHTIDANIIPSASGIVNLGSSALPFSTLYVDDNIETSASGIFCLGDPNTDGTWRFTRENDNLVFQRRESSAWVTKSTLTP